MPTYMFEAMDAAGAAIRDEIEAPSEDKAQETIRQMGYFVTKISVKKARKAAGAKTKDGKKRGLAIGGVSSKLLTAFTRQLSILQDAGLPILRSLKILEEQAKPGRLKYSLMDTCEEIESGSTLSEAMAKSPKCFDRLYVNMIKAGEAGGALEIILRRLADFMEASEALKRKVKGAMIYPIVVVMVAVGILVVHHDQDRADVSADLHRLRYHAATAHLDPDRHLGEHGQVLVPDSDDPVGDRVVCEAAEEIQSGPDGL